MLYKIIQVQVEDYFTKHTNNTITKEFLSIINQIYQWRLFCTRPEHYNCLQFTKLFKMANYIQKIIKGPAKLSVAHWYKVLACSNLIYK